MLSTWILSFLLIMVDARLKVDMKCKCGVTKEIKSMERIFGGEEAGVCPCKFGDFYLPGHEIPMDRSLCKRRWQISGKLLLHLGQIYLDLSSSLFLTLPLRLPTSGL